MRGKKRSRDSECRGNRRERRIEIGYVASRMVRGESREGRRGDGEVRTQREVIAKVAKGNTEGKKKDDIVERNGRGGQKGRKEMKRRN